MATISKDLIYWNDGCKDCDSKNYSKGIQNFLEIREKSSISFFNIAYAYYLSGDLKEAKLNITSATKKDKYLCVAFWLEGIIDFKTKKYFSAAESFDNAFKNLRGQECIDYTQRGMRCKITNAELLYNHALAVYKNNDRLKAVDLLTQAGKSCKSRSTQLVIKTALDKVNKKENVEKLLELPADAFFRPPKSKIVSLEKQDYLGKAKVISAVDSTNVLPGFEAPRKLAPDFLKAPAAKVVKSAPSSPAMKRHEIDDDDAEYIPIYSGSEEILSSEVLDEFPLKKTPPPRPAPDDPQRNLAGLLNKLGQPPSRTPPQIPDKSAAKPPLPGRAPAVPPSSASPPTGSSGKPPINPRNQAPTSGPPSRVPPRPDKSGPTANKKPVAAQPSSSTSPPPAKPAPRFPRTKDSLDPPTKPLLSRVHSRSADDIGNVNEHFPDRGENFPSNLDSQRTKTPVVGEGRVKALAGTLNTLGVGIKNLVTSKSSQDLTETSNIQKPKPGKRDQFPNFKAAANKCATLPIDTKPNFSNTTNASKAKTLPRPPSIEVTPPESYGAGPRRSSVDVLLPVRVKGAKPVKTTIEEFRGISPGASDGENSENELDYDEPYQVPTLPPRPNKSPEPTHKPPLPNKRSSEEEEELVKLKITCNKTKQVNVKPGTPLQELLLKTCAEFKLSRGTIDLWLKEKGELIPIEDQKMMDKFWANASKYDYSLWCFSK